MHPRICHALGLILFYSSIILYLRSKCWRDPTSLFFQASRAHEAEYSALRIQQALEYADLVAAITTTTAAAAYPPANTTTTTNPQPYPQPQPQPQPPDLCIGIPSVSRPDLLPGISYLKSTLGSLHQGLSPSERSKLHFIVLLAHTDPPSQHADYGAPWLDFLSDDLISYSSSSSSFDSTTSQYNNNNYLETAREMERGEGGWGVSHSIKSKFDYSLVLEACQEKTQAAWTLMVEDDVVFLDGWLHRTLKGLEMVAAEREEAMRMFEDGKEEEEIMYLRLFWYERLLGWNYSESLGKYLVSSLLVMAAAAVLCALIVLTTRHRRRQQHHRCCCCCFPWTATTTPSLRYRNLLFLLLNQNTTTLFVVFFITPSLIILFFAAGTNCISLFPFYSSPSSSPSSPLSVHRMPHHACCGQGLVFPRETVTRRLLPHFRKNLWSEVPTDSFLEAYADENEEMSRWAISPVVMQHVGGRSSHGVDRGGEWGGVMRPSWIWNFGFEENDAGVLGREHAEVIISEEEEEERGRG